MNALFYVDMSVAFAWRTGGTVQYGGGLVARCQREGWGESGARPSAPDKIHFTSQSHQTLQTVYMHHQTSHPCPLSFVPARFPLPSIPPRWPSWDCETESERKLRPSLVCTAKWRCRRKKKAIPYPRLPFRPRSLYRRRRRRLYSQSSPPVQLALDGFVGMLALQGRGRKRDSAIARTPNLQLVARGKSCFDSWIATCFTTPLAALGGAAGRRERERRQAGQRFRFNIYIKNCIKSCIILQSPWEVFSPVSCAPCPLHSLLCVAAVLYSTVLFR